MELMKIAQPVQGRDFLCGWILPEATGVRRQPRDMSPRAECSGDKGSMTYSKNIVVFGVSGAGKTTVGQRLADALHRPFADADDFHPPESVRKMSASIPLTDSDRFPWLQSVRDWMDRQNDEGNGTVVACSALKRAYRDALRAGRGGVLFVHLSGTPEIIRGRLDGRSGHFMPAALLASQFEALEPLAPDECGLQVDVESPVDSIVSAVCDRIQMAG